LVEAVTNRTERFQKEWFQLAPRVVLGVIFMRRSKALHSVLMTAVAGFLALNFACLPAGPATANATLGVSAMVQATCLVSASPLGFGAYIGAATTATSAVSVTCTNSTPYNVGLSAGAGGSATVASRKMTGPGSALLSYSLFSDPSRKVNWGQTVGTDTVAGMGNGAAQMLTVYAQTVPGQYVTPGTYTDMVAVTVTY
jgi:spore coat protein U-like protein